MKVRVQMCWCGNEKFVARALICGGLRVRAPDGRWSRAVAAEMRSVICQEVPAVKRENIRFVHV